jgi:hypothetical protein
LNANTTRTEQVALNAVPRAAIATWTHAAEIPELTSELKERMYELGDRKNARKSEVGLPSELLAIVRAIEYDYDEASVIAQIQDYKQRSYERTKPQII